jgi:hypothetical protein
MLHSFIPKSGKVVTYIIVDFLRNIYFFVVFCVKMGALSAVAQSPPLTGPYVRSRRRKPVSRWLHCPVRLF